jgi:hypothetical protein
MGNKIIKASQWSLRPVFLLYGKIVTLVFALYCVAFGQTVKVAASSPAARTIKGKVLFASDLTIIKKIKLYLCSVQMPVYGMSFTPSYYILDSTTSDINGDFSINTTNISPYNPNLAIKTNKLTHGGYTLPFVSQTIYYPLDKDTAFTFYLKPYIPSAVEEQSTTSSANQFHISHGKTVSINICDWLGDKKTASVINIKGETMAILYAAANGTIQWHTDSVAKGVYFLQVKSSVSHATITITVQ